jgi:hypothetical protein
MWFCLLFLEMAIFSKDTFHKENVFVKENEEYYEILWTRIDLFLKNHNGNQILTSIYVWNWTRIWN